MKFSTPIVCDDIRREQGNKRSIIGAYADKIIFGPQMAESAFPIQKQFGIYLVARREEADAPIDSFECNISIIDPAGKSATKNLVLIKGQIEDKSNPTIVFDFVAPFSIPFLGTLKMIIRAFNGSDEVGRLEEDLIEIVIQPADKPASQPPA